MHKKEEIITPAEFNSWNAMKNEKSEKDNKTGRAHRVKRSLIAFSPFFVLGVLAITGTGPFSTDDFNIQTKTVKVEYGTQLSANLINTTKGGLSDHFVKMNFAKNSYNPKKLGSYKVKVKAKDLNNKKTEETITVKVVDTKAPLIKTTAKTNEDGKLKVEAGKDFKVTDYVKAVDKADGVTKVRAEKAVDPQKTGEQKLVVTSKDSSGNVSKKTITADVEDTEAPVITVDDTRVDLKSDFNISDYVTCIDALDGKVEPKVSGDIDTSKAGSYVIKLTAQDKAGNKTEKDVTFVVGDYTAPDLELKKSADEVPAGKPFDAKSMIKSAVDDIDGDIADKVKISDFSTEKEGKTEVTYMVSDSAGNQSVKKLDLTVTNPYELLAKKIESTGRTKLGSPYVFGASGPTVFDCSGYTMWVYSRYGIHLPHSAASQYSMCQKISSSEARKGDLVFFANTYKPGISHVGIYLGNGKLLEASGRCVKESELSGSRAKSFYGFGRILTKEHVDL